MFITLALDAFHPGYAFISCMLCSKYVITTMSERIAALQKLHYTIIYLNVII